MFTNKKALVIGGTGLIGIKVVDELVKMRATVFSVSIDSLRPNPNAHYVQGNLANYRNCLDIIDGYDFVFHCAGVKGSAKMTKEMPASMFVTPLQMNTNILEACRVNKVGQVVFVSSIGAYPDVGILRENVTHGEPMDAAPGWVKLMAELQIKYYVEQYDLKNFSVVRPCAVYGEGDNFDPATAMFIPALMAKIARDDNPVEVWGDGSEIREVAYSGDIATGIIQAVVISTKGQFVNLGTGKGYSIKEIVDTMHGIVEFKHEYMPSKATGQKLRIMDISLAKKLLGYSPKVTLAEGLKRTWDWFIAHKDEYKRRYNQFEKDNEK